MPKLRLCVGMPDIEHKKQKDEQMSRCESEGNNLENFLGLSERAHNVSRFPISYAR